MGGAPPPAGFSPRAPPPPPPRRLPATRRRAGVHRQDEFGAGELGQLAAEQAELVVVERPRRQRDAAELLDGGGDQVRVAGGGGSGPRATARDTREGHSAA